MREIVEVSTINDYCAAFNLSALHPLVSVLDLSQGSWRTKEKIESVRYHFYGVFLKQGQNCVLQYGRQNYDYQDGTLVFIGPGQVINISHIDHEVRPSGYALVFHPDLLQGTNLGRSMDSHSFFSYELREALHLSGKEREIVLDCFDKIHYELLHGIDKHSKNLIVSNIELFLKYCTRFYDRQFITRDTANLWIIENFESALNSYMKSGKAKYVVQMLGGMGNPTVQMHANQLVTRMAKLTGAEPHVLSAPGVAQSREAKLVLLSDTFVRETMDLFSRPISA